MFKQPKDTNISNTINNNRSTSQELINGSLLTSSLNIKIKETINKISECIRSIDYEKRICIVSQFSDILNLSLKYLNQCSDYKDIILESDEMLDACKEVLANSLRNGLAVIANMLISFMKEQGVPQEKIYQIVNDNEILSSCKNGIIGPYGSIEEIFLFMKEQNVTQENINEIANDNEVLIVYKKILESFLTFNELNSVERIFFHMKEQNVSQERIDEIINSNEIISGFKHNIIFYLTHVRLGYDNQEDTKHVLSIMKKYGVSDEKIIEIVNSYETLMSCKAVFCNCLKIGKFDTIEEILSIMKEHFVPEEKIDEMFNSDEMFEACMTGLVVCLHLKKIDSAKNILSIMEKRSVPQKKIKEIILNVCKQEFATPSNYRNIDYIKNILLIAEEQGIPHKKTYEIFKSNEVINACIDTATCWLQSGHADIAEEILSFMIKQK